MVLFKRQNSIYYIQYFDEVENRLKRISTKQTSKNLANKFLSNLKEKLEAKAKLKFITLKNFSEQYIEFIKNLYSRKYYESVKWSFRILLREFDSDIPLNNLRPSDLETFLYGSYQKTKFSATAHYRNLRSSFNKAIEWGYIAENPTKKIKLPKIERNFPLFVNEAELNLIIEKTKDRDLKDIFLFAFHSGCRLSEILNAQWKSIDFSNSIIRIINSETFKTKSKRERVIPINSTLAAMLRNRIPKIFDITKEQYLFQKFEGVRYSGDFVSKSFKNAILKVGLNPKLHFHTLRHSFASNLVQRGVSIYIVKELLGHSDISTTSIYAHLQHDNLMQAVKMLDSQRLVEAINE